MNVRLTNHWGGTGTLGSWTWMCAH